MFSLRTIVEDSSGIIFHHKNHISTLKIESVTLPKAMLFGQTTQPFDAFSNASFHALGIMFYPHTIKELFGIDAHFITDQMIDLKHFMTVDLIHRIVNAVSLSNQIELISHFLMKKITEKKGEDNLIKDAVIHIKRNKGLMLVRDLHRHYSISERQFERRFLTTIGVSPRHYLLTTRFQAAVELIKTESFSKLSDIAYDLDYADQSHFIRQVKKMSGMKPRELKQKLTKGPVNLIIH